MKRLVRMFVWWLAFSAFFQMPLLPRLIHLYRLDRDGVVATGTVNGKTYHQEVVYEFSVSGKVYSGDARTGIAGIPTFDSISLGDRIPISYLPADPGINCGGEVQVLLKDEYVFRGLLGLLAFVGVVFLFLRVAFFPKTRILGIPAQRLKPWLF